MRKALIKVNGQAAAVLIQEDNGKYFFYYNYDYQGAPVSLTLPLSKKPYEFMEFPAFFEGLLPEGAMLESLLRKYKLDRNDYFSQLLQVGHDVVGAVNIEEIT